MSNTSFKLSRLVLMSGLALSAAMLSPSFDPQVVSGISFLPTVHAEEDGGGSKGKGSKGGAGMGQRGSVGEHGQVKGAGHGQRDVMMKGQGGPGEDSDRPAWAGVKGGKAGAGTKPGSAGTKKGDLFGDLYVLLRDPVTGGALTETVSGKEYPRVQAYTKDADGNLVLVPNTSIPRDAEGNLILTTYTPQEVEFSRLNVARAPSKVFDRQLSETVKTLSSGTIGVDPATGRLTVTTSSGTSTIDSPLANLAIYQALLKSGSLSGGTLSAGGLTVTLPTSFLAASALAAAADKSKVVNLDMVMYMSSFLGLSTNLSSVSYDRQTTWGNVYVEVLVQVGSVYEVQNVNVYDAVFGGVNDGVSQGALDYSTQVNDTVRVIQFVHDNSVR